MKTFRMFVRRLLIVAAATTLGTAAVIALSATPAYAHDVAIAVSKDCVNGNWVVTWTVKNDQAGKIGTLTAVTHSHTTPALNVIKVTAQVPAGSPGTLSETVTYPGSTESARLAVTMTWPRRTGDDSTSKRVDLGDTCVPPTPEYTATDDSDCDSISVTVTNTGKIEISGTVSSGGDSRPFTLAPNATSQPFEFPGGDGVTATVAVQGADSKTFTWKDPGDCPTPTTPPPPPTTTTPDLPVTGASLTSLVGVGGALVLVGGVLLFVLRHRRRLSES